MDKHSVTVTMFVIAISIIVHYVRTCSEVEEMDGTEIVEPY